MAISKGQIELESGAIIPTRHTLWSQAAGKIAEAGLGIKQMESASSRSAYQDGWVRFVESIQEFWVLFTSEGKASFPSFEGWVSQIEHCRKNDDLLVYLYQARHQSQHGGLTIEWESDKLQIAPGFNGVIKTLGLYKDGAYQFDADSYSGDSPKVVLKPGKAVLPTIVNKKHRQTYPAPKRHAGRLFSPSPIRVAKLGHAYYGKAFSDAKAKDTLN